MSVLTAISRDDALRYTRQVGSHETLFAMRMAPMSGNTPVDIPSVEALEAFLVVVTPEEAGRLDMSLRVNYTDPKAAASWIREIIGDAHLADALDEVIATDRVFGLLVPDIKRVLTGRLEEYREALGDSGPDPE